MPGPATGILNAPILDGIPLILISGEELAALMKFDGVTSGFRAWCKELGIKTVPKRRDVYDPKHVRERLDAAQGMIALSDAAPSQPISLVDQRRARRGKN